MDDKITDAQVAEVQALLQSSASTDAKAQQVNRLKAGIKHANVPDACVGTLFEILRNTSASPHAALSNVGFSALSHLLQRMTRQEPKYVAKEAQRTLPLLMDKLGDPRDKYRGLAAQCLTTIWGVAPMDAERAVKNTGMTGKNPRAKESSMHWLLQMYTENGLQFRGFVPTLMELLEDADGMVRDTAKATVIELFRNAPNTAKSDLKRQLKTFNVRPAIATAITSTLAPSAPTETDSGTSSMTSSKIQLGDSVSLVASIARSETPSIEAKVESVDPAYVNTHRELDEIFRDMLQFFEGKESEQNWLKREQSCTKLRRLNAGNAPADYHDAFIAGIKSMLDGILKAVNSLRTSLSKEGCFLLQELARMLGPGLDGMVEILLQNLIKLCAGTKKISSQQGNETVDVIISRVSYTARIMQHIWLACQDKNVQPRLYATGWLKSLLKKEGHHRSHIEHGGGAELVEKCVKRGLADANAGVRERMRSTYWTFAQIWPQRAETILSNLEVAQQRLLEADPGNPKSPKKTDVASRPGLGFSKSTTGPPKPSLRETMLAQKKAAMAARNIPPRPESAMSAFSPVRTTSSSSTSSTTSKTSDASASSRSRPEPTSTVSHGGLSVAPMRPTKFKRPEIARPATAGPYSVRRPNAPSTETTNTSPTITRPRAVKTPTTAVSPPKKPMPRPNTSHSNHSHTGSLSSHASPPKKPTGRATPSPRTSPVKLRNSPARFGSSPPKPEEELTMVIPTFNGMYKSRSDPAPIKYAEPEDLEDDDVVTPMKALKVYEDPFTSADDNTTPRPAVTQPVLEEVVVNEDAANIPKPVVNDGDVILSKTGAADGPPPPPAAILSPERSKQNARLLESGITRIRARSLDVHGFRKLQGLLREAPPRSTSNSSSSSISTANLTAGAVVPAERLDALIPDLFGYLEAALPALGAEKAQDVKAQVLATLKLLLRTRRPAFAPHVLAGLASVLRARGGYDARAHLVGGLELLAAELVALAEPARCVASVGALLWGADGDGGAGAAADGRGGEEAAGRGRATEDRLLATTEGCRTLSMGLHVLQQLLEQRTAYVPDAAAFAQMARLAARCLAVRESSVRMGAVALCVALHARVGEEAFWGREGGFEDVGQSERNLITYYVVKRQREAGGGGGGGGA